MLKGFISSFPGMLAITIGLVGVFILIIMAVSEIGDVSIKTKVSLQDLNAVDAAHLIENCFAKGGYITAEFLDANSGKDICSIAECGFCNVDIRAKAEDLNSGREWDFDYGSGEASHSIFINIKEGEEIHLGRLYVRTEA